MILNRSVVKIYIIFALLISNSCGNHVVSFIRKVLQMYNLNTIVIFQNENCADIISCELPTLLTKASLSSAIIFSKRPKFLPKILNKHRILAIVLLENRDDPIKEEASETLKGIRLSKFLFIHNYKSVPPKDLNGLFTWCSDKNILNAAAIFQSENNEIQVFISDSFPKLDVLNRTGCGVEGIFPDKVKNIKGYSFKFPVQLDAPRVFKTWRNGRPQVTGFAGYLLMEFIRRLNGTYKETIISGSNKYVDMNQIYSLLRLKKMDVSIHPYENFNRSWSSSSYPIALTKWCLMVPTVNEIPSYMYLILPFNPPIWFLMIISIFVTATLQFTLAPDFSKAICDSIRAMLYVPIPGLSLKRKPMHIVIAAIALIQGFLLSNLYVASLTSFFTKTVYGVQYITAGDIVRAKLKVMTVSYELHDLLNSWKFPPQLKSSVLEVDADTMGRHRDALNTSFTYLMSTDRWAYLIMQEQYLRRHTFRISNICVGSFIVSFPMQLDSPFAETLDLFIMASQQVGLHNKWKNRAFQEAVQEGLITIVRSAEQSSRPMSFTQFALMWHVLGIGTFFSLFCFAAEHLTNYFERTNWKHFKIIWNTIKTVMEKLAKIYPKERISITRRK